MGLIIRILSILLAIAFVVLAYYVVIWILGLLGIHIPQNILTVIFVIIGLMAAIGALSGQFDNIFRWPNP
jgi:bacteriorhodopsin